jgi:prepilin-type processing-associated H-X9-DG protein
LVVIAIIGMLIALLLPAIQQAREAARRMQCSNHQKQWALAAHTYHDANQTLPPFGKNAPYHDSKNNTESTDAFSWTVWLLPFIEQQAVADMTKNNGTAASVNGTFNYKKMGPSWDVNYLPWTIKFSIILCPSEINQDRTGADFPGTSSYRCCAGDETYVYNENAWARGIFQWSEGFSLDAATDGTSNTLLFSESKISLNPTDARTAIAQITKNAGVPNACLAMVTPNDKTKFITGAETYDPIGRRWAHGREWAYFAFNATQAPNTVSCFLWKTTTRMEREMSLPPSSYHSGGVNAARADGSVSFINNTINTGDPSKQSWKVTGQSPFGVFGSLATRDSGESVSP